MEQQFVDYKISDDDYQILKMAVRDMPEAAAALARAVPIDVKNVKIKERLSVEKMRSLFGVNYNGVIYFDFETSGWNKNYFMGYPVNHTADVWEFKRVWDLIPMGQKYDLLACVVMPVDVSCYPGKGRIIEKPNYNPYSKLVAGTVVCRDKKTGMILPQTSQMIAVGDFGSSYGAINQAMGHFANKFAKRWPFRTAVLNTLQKNK